MSCFGQPSYEPRELGNDDKECRRGSGNGGGGAAPLPIAPDALKAALREECQQMQQNLENVIDLKLSGQEHAFARSLEQFAQRLDPHIRKPAAPTEPPGRPGAGSLGPGRCRGERPARGLPCGELLRGPKDSMRPAAMEDAQPGPGVDERLRPSSCSPVRTDVLAASPLGRLHSQNSNSQRSLLRSPSMSRAKGSQNTFFGWVIALEDKMRELEDKTLRFFLYERLYRTVDWWFSLEEPRRTGLFARIVDGTKFEVLCLSVIILNSLFSVYTTNYEVSHYDNHASPSIFVSLERAFVFFYCAELVLKISVHRLYFFCNDEMRWNLFDFALVIFSLIDQITMFILTSNDNDRANVDVTFMRSFRIMKLVKILRAVRIMRFFAELRIILNSIMGSFTSLLWSFAMLGFIFYIFGLILVQAVTGYFQGQGDELDVDIRKGLTKSFGSVQASILTLFLSVTGGQDWEHYYWQIERTGVMSVVLFIFFIAFMQIALMNILTGLFVESAMKLAAPDRENLALELRRTLMSEAETLWRFCKEMDVDGSGTISAEEFRAQMENDRFKAHLQVMGLCIQDAEIFFNMMLAADEAEEVDIECFVYGCMRLKGHATSIDLQSLVYQTHLIHKSQHEFSHHVLEQLQALSELTPAVAAAAVAEGLRGLGTGAGAGTASTDPMNNPRRTMRGPRIVEGNVPVPASLLGDCSSSAVMLSMDTAEESELHNGHTFQSGRKIITEINCQTFAEGAPN